MTIIVASGVSSNGKQMNMKIGTRDSESEGTYSDFFMALPDMLNIA